MKVADWVALAVLVVIMILWGSAFHTFSGIFVLALLAIGWLFVRRPFPSLSIFCFAPALLIVLLNGIFPAGRINSEEWRKIRAFYEESGITLSLHDQGVIDSAARQAGVNPSRVILTLISRPGVPNGRHWPEDDAEGRRYSRIWRVYYSTAWHPGVVKKVTKVEFVKLKDAMWPYSAPNGQEVKPALEFVN